MIYIFGLNLLALGHFVVFPLIGIGLAVRRWRDQRRFALAATCGFLAFVIAACMRAFAATAVLIRAQRPTSQDEVLQTAGYLCGSAAFVFEVAALVLLLVCVFKWRGSATTAQG